MKNSRTGQVLILIAVLSLVAVTSFSTKSSVTQRTGPVQASLPALTAVFLSTPGGANHTDDLAHKDKTITFAVNVTNSPEINGFTVTLGYNTNMYTVNFTGVDFSTNPIGPVSGTTPKAFVAAFCVDSLDKNGLACSLTNSQKGDVSLAISGLTNQTTPPGETHFALFYVTFNIIGTGLGQVHILEAELTQGLGSQVRLIPLQPFGDAYYNNLGCPVLPCKPPTVNFGFNPKNPSPGTVVTFNASVTIHNSGAVASSYTWDWGDGQAVSYQDKTTVPNISQPITHEYNPATVGIGSCIGAGNCTVTLSVLESDGILWSTSRVVPIFHFTVLVRISNPQANPQLNVVPGTIVQLTASIVNLGTISEYAWAHIKIEGRELAKGNYTLTQAGGIRSSAVIQATWNTSGYLPRIYAIDVTLANVSSTQSHIDPITLNPVFYIGDLNATREDVATSIYVMLISPQVNGALSLSLLQTTGVGALVFVAFVAALTKLRRKPGYESEPL